MSKGRLEEIKNKQSIDNLHNNIVAKYVNPPFVTIKSEDYEWLIEQADRVQELGSETHILESRLEGAVKYNDAMKIIADDYEQQNKRYREFLNRIHDTDDIVEVYDIVDEYKTLEASE